MPGESATKSNRAAKHGEGGKGASALFLAELKSSLKRVWTFPILPIVASFLYWKEDVNASVLPQHQTFVLSCWTLWISAALVVEYSVSEAGFLFLLVLNFASFIFLDFDNDEIEIVTCITFCLVYLIALLFVYFFVLVFMRKLIHRGSRSRLSTLISVCKEFGVVLLGFIGSLPLAPFVPLWQIYYLFKTGRRGGANGPLAVLMFLPVGIGLGATALAFSDNAPAWQHSLSRFIAAAAFFTSARNLFWGDFIIENRKHGDFDTKILPMKSSGKRNSVIGDIADAQEQKEKEEDEKRKVAEEAAAKDRIETFDFATDDIWSSAGRRKFANNMRRGIADDAHEARPGIIEKWSSGIFKKLLWAKNLYSKNLGFRGRYVRFKLAAFEFGEIAIQSANIMTVPLLKTINIVQSCFVALNTLVIFPLLLSDREDLYRDGVLITETIFDIIYVVLMFRSVGHPRLENYSTWAIISLLMPLLATLHFISQLSDEYMWYRFVDENKEDNQYARRVSQQNKTKSKFLKIQTGLKRRKKKRKASSVRRVWLKRIIMIGGVAFACSMSYRPIHRFLTTKDYCIHFSPGQMVDPGCKALEWSLSNITDESLPRNMNLLKHVTRIDVAFNELKTIEFATDMPNLLSLDASNNQLTVLPRNTEKLKNLTYLDVSSNGVSTLPVEITNLPSLAEVRYDGNPLQTIECWWPQSNKVIELGVGKAGVLDLSGRGIDAFDDALLGIILKYAGKAKTLDLSDNKLTNVWKSLLDLSLFDRILLRNNKIKRLNVSVDLAKDVFLDIYGNPINHVDASWSNDFEVEEYDSHAWRKVGVVPFASAGEECLVTHSPWSIQCRGRNLDLSGCLLKSFSLDTSRLHSLQHLNLSNNMLTKLSSSKGMIGASMRSIDLSNNLIANTNQIGAINLTHINVTLDNNPITGVEGSEWCKTFNAVEYSPASSERAPAVIGGDCECLAYSNPWSIQCSGTHLDILDGVLSSKYLGMKGVMTLNMSGLGLQALPGAVEDMTQLQVLDVSFNKLQRIDIQLQKLPNLYEFNIKGNPIIDFDDEWTSFFNVYEYTWSGPLLPKHFKNTNGDLLSDCLYSQEPHHPFSLQCGGKYLTVSNCASCDSIPYEIRQLRSLRTLTYANCTLPSIPQFLGGMQSLKRLYVQHNEIDTIPPYSWLTKLHALVLDGNPITSVASTMVSWFEDEYKTSSYEPVDVSKFLAPVKLAGCECLRYGSPLGYVQCRGNTLNIVHEPGTINTAYSSLVSLRRLNAAGSEITSIPQDYFSKLVELTSLDLSGNELADFPISTRGLAKLRLLDISSNQLSVLPNNIFDGAFPLLEHLDVSKNQLQHFPSTSSLTSMTFFNASSNSISTLPQSLLQLSSLNEIDMSFNLIEQFPSINLLEQNSLTRLHLEGNAQWNISSLHMNRASAELMFSIARSLPFLRTLDLSDKNINSIDADLFQNGMAGIPSLEKVFLDRNDISDTSPLSSAIKQNHNLTHISLKDNAIGNGGMGVLGDAVSTLHNLKYLDLRENEYDMIGAGKLAEKGVVHISTILFDQNSDLGGKGYGDDDAMRIAHALPYFSDLGTLDLGDNGIGPAGAAALAASIAPSHQITHLRISSNRLGNEGAASIAAALKNCQNLSILSLSNNNISDSGAGAIAKELPYVPGLEQLWLSENSIGETGILELAKTANRTSLREFGIARNGDMHIKIAEALAQLLEKLPMLTLFSAYRNNIGDDEVAALAKGLKHTNLEILFLSNNRIGDQGAVALSDAMQNMSLSELVIHANEIGHIGAAALSNAIKESGTLTRLDMDANHIGPAGAASIADSLKYSNGMSILGVAGNSIGVQGAESIASALKHISLTELYISSNSLSRNGSMAIAEALKYAPSLEVLSMFNNDMGDAAAVAIGNVLNSTNALTRLFLSQNSISDDGAAAIARGLKHNLQLEILTLHTNQIGLAGAAYLSESLSPKLKRFDLSYNDIGSDGGALIGKKLMHCSDLEILDLSANNLGDTGAQGVAEGIKFHSSLLELKLHTSNIGPSGASALANALNKHTGLQELDMDNNYISDEGASALAQVLPKLTSLETLYVNANSIQSAGAQAIAGAFVHMPHLSHFSISDNSIQSAGADALGKALVHVPSLVMLSAWGNEIGPTGAEFICEGLKSTPLLVILLLSNNNAGSKGAAACAAALEHLPLLSELYFHTNSIQKEGAIAFAEALKHVPLLAELHFDVNDIDAEGARAIASSLGNIPRIETLTLGNNNIGNNGTAALLEAIRSSSVQIKKLVLFTNGIDVEGAHNLAWALDQLPSLTHLDLDFNSIGNYGAGALATHFVHINKLEELFLSGNGIGDSGASSIALHLKHLPNLKTLHIGGASNGGSFEIELENNQCKAGHMFTVEGTSQDGAVSVEKCGELVSQESACDKPILMMFSTDYPEWGCRCCTGHSSGEIAVNQPHDHWDLYSPAKITNVGAEKLANELGNLLHLAELNLQQNAIQQAGIDALFAAKNAHPNKDVLDVIVSGASEQPGPKEDKCANRCDSHADGDPCCGPLFGDRVCVEFSAAQDSFIPYCNEANGWCGGSQAHELAQASSAYDAYACDTPSPSTMPPSFYDLDTVQCDSHPECGSGNFCAVECFQGPCNGKPAGTMGQFCQPCRECHHGHDAFDNQCPMNC